MPTVWTEATHSDATKADTIGIINWKADVTMLHTITRAPYFTSTLVLGLALFTALLFFTEIWFLLTGTVTVSHSRLALGYAALSSLLPLWGIYRDRRD